MQVRFVICALMKTIGVFLPIEGGNVVFERSLPAISPNGLLFVLHQKKNKSSQTNQNMRTAEQVIPKNGHSEIKI